MEDSSFLCFYYNFCASIVPFVLLHHLLLFPHCCTLYRNFFSHQMTTDHWLEWLNYFQWLFMRMLTNFNNLFDSFVELKFRNTTEHSETHSRNQCSILVKWNECFTCADVNAERKIDLEWEKMLIRCVHEMQTPILDSHPFLGESIVFFGENIAAKKMYSFAKLLKLDVYILYISVYI